MPIEVTEVSLRDGEAIDNSQPHFRRTRSWRKCSQPWACRDLRAPLELMSIIFFPRVISPMQVIGTPLIPAGIRVALRAVNRSS